MSFQPYPQLQTRGERRRPKESARGQDGAGSRHCPVSTPERSDSAFTLGHGRHQVRLGPVAFWTAVGSLVIMAGWSIVTATYFAFHDDVLTRLIARQADMQFAYEDRIAELRSQIDRVTSRQMLDQEQFERKLDYLARRQATLESRAAAINALADPTTTGSVKSPRGNPADGAAAKASPMSETSPAPTVRDRDKRADNWAMQAVRHASAPVRGALAGTLSHFQSALDRIEQRQIKALELVEESFDVKARRMRAVLTDLGLDAGKPAGSKAPATGGPFVPLRASTTDNGGFERQLQRIQLARATVDRLHKTLVTVPVRTPLLGEIDTSSGFGVRMDPFLRTPAMHTGLDFRGTTGDPVRATAAGTVTVAGWNGGYGKMVEIDHGNGFATRYGHLSSIDVEVGDKIKNGGIVGKLGSTGRSTGPHLHYETRIDGDAVDPQKFLRAGAKLGAS